MRRSGDQPNGPQLHLHATPAVHADSHFLGHFAVLRIASEFHGEIPSDRIHLLLTLAEVTGSPVELAQAIEDGALDAVLGVALKGYVLRRIVLVYGIDQTQHP